jgi:hypothetical protein
LGKVGFGILFQFPIRDFTFFAGIPHPFVTEPAGGPGGFGISHHKALTAMGRDFGVFPFVVNLPNAVQRTVAGRPKFDFFQKPEEIHMFSIVAFIAVGCHHYSPNGKKQAEPASACFS